MWKKKMFDFSHDQSIYLTNKSTITQSLGNSVSNILDEFLIL